MIAGTTLLSNLRHVHDRLPLLLKPANALAHAGIIMQVDREDSSVYSAFSSFIVANRNVFWNGPIVMSSL